MSYLMVLNVSFFIYIFFYFVVEKLLNEKVAQFDIPNLVKKTLGKYTLDDVSVDVQAKNKPSYAVIDKVIHINNKATLKTLANSFHELGHAVCLKGKDFKDNNLLLNILFLFLDYSFVLGVMGVIFSQHYSFNFYITLFIKISLFIGTVYLGYVLREEYMASKIGYNNIKQQVPSLSNLQRKKVLLFLINSFSSYFFFFIVTGLTAVYFIL